MRTQLSILLAAASLATISQPALAQPERSAAPATGAEGDIIVTGTRDPERRLIETIAPVDLLTGTEVQATVTSDLSATLAQLLPSFNVQRLPLADGAVFVRPARLRGLSPDHTLVLVNGRRYHRSALLGNRGAQAPDLASIPSFAIGRVEVLRDGAAAQYGSDAIAGVINILLDAEPGVHAFGQLSQYYAGDGRTWQAGQRSGLALGDGGALVVTAEYANGEPTSRTRQRPDAIAFQNRNPTLFVPNPVQRWGQPDLQNLRAAANLVLPLGALDLSGFAIFRKGDGVSDFNWRNPDDTAAVFRPTTVFPGFTFRQRFPAGFTPRFGSEFEDLHLSGSAAADLASNLQVTASLGWGRNLTDYTLDETVNASLGPASPTSFYLGRIGQRETNINLDLLWRPDIGLARPLNIALGGERRAEIYTIRQGDPESFAVGPGAREGLAPNANGFPGFSDLQAGRFSQTSLAAYLDVEAAPIERLTLAGALRYEDYSRFGDTLDWRVGGRFELLDDVALRASYSTGFRAPTPAQLFSTNTSQGLDTRTLQIFTRGRLSPGDPLAIQLGARPLTPETARTLTAGLAAEPLRGLRVTLDGYRIRVEDRFGESPAFPVPAGVPNPNNFTAVSYFTNDFTTRTSGFDLVLAWNRTTAAGPVAATLAYSWTRTRVLEDRTTTIPNETQRIIFEERIPGHNATASLSLPTGPIEWLARARYYGPWTDATGNATGDIFQRFGSILLVDLSATLRLAPGVRLQAGAENIFNAYPEEAVFQANRGLIYSRNAPYDTDGGQWFVRLAADF